jgi:hypothetical protein
MLIVSIRVMVMMNEQKEYQPFGQDHQENNSSLLQ